MFNVLSKRIYRSFKFLGEGMLKIVCREKIIKLKKLINSEDRIRKSLAAQNKVMNIINKRNVRMVMCFVSMPDEIETRGIIDILLAKGIRVCVPYIKNKEMKAVEIFNLDDLSYNEMGFYQPISSLDEILKNEIDLIIVPGIAFNYNCERLGRGGGYYDKFLSKAEKAYFIGLAYDFQIVKDFKTEKHDVPMDMVVSDKRTIVRGENV